MPDRIITYISFVVLFIGLNACNTGDDIDRIPLARVGDQVLYLSELRSVLPQGLSPEDSIMLTEDYIKKWIISELMVRKAEENLTPALKDLTKELNDYRNSMLTYRYKMELMLQRLDTTVNDREINDYYNLYKDNFILSKDIVKAIYIQIPKEVSQPEQVKVFCEQVTDDNLRELREFCVKYAVTYDIFVDNWVELESVAQYLPEQIEDNQQLLRRNAMIELRDEKAYHLLCIIEYRLANSVAPIEYVSENIKNLIINKRKLDFLKKIEEDVYTEGIRNSKFKLYDYEPEKIEN